MQVTATEFKLNFGKYLEMVVAEDIYITRNGKTVAKMINPSFLTDSILNDIKNIYKQNRTIFSFFYNNINRFLSKGMMAYVHHV